MSETTGGDMPAPQEESGKISDAHPLGQSPENLDRKEHAKQYISDKITDLRKAARESGQNVDHEDIAYVIAMHADKKNVIAEDVTEPEFLRRLGLTEGEIEDFVPKTLPKMKLRMEEQKQKEQQENETEQEEVALQFCQRWGLDRLNHIAEYYQKERAKLIKINSNWGNTILRYLNSKDKLKQDLEQLKKPTEKAKLLRDQAHYLTLFDNHELMQICSMEEDLGTYPYLDSLLEASMAVYNASINPEDKTKRIWAMKDLTFGAKTPNETTSLFKRQVKVKPFALLKTEGKNYKI